MEPTIGAGREGAGTGMVGAGFGSPKDGDGSRLWVAARRRRPTEVGDNRPGQRHAAQLGGRYQPRADDLSVVEPQLGQLL
jgi:hypothetical protein